MIYLRLNKFLVTGKPLESDLLLHLPKKIGDFHLWSLLCVSWLMLSHAEGGKMK